MQEHTVYNLYLIDKNEIADDTHGVFSGKISVPLAKHALLFTLATATANRRWNTAKQEMDSACTGLFSIFFIA